MRILVNAVNLTGAGARTIGFSHVPALVRTMSHSDFVVLLPDQEPFNTINFPANVTVLFSKRKVDLPPKNLYDIS
jgi:hypothetical protein